MQGYASVSPILNAGQRVIHSMLAGEQSRLAAGECGGGGIADGYAAERWRSGPQAAGG